MASDDQTLLRQFAQDRSEAAFAELVERHLKMVYATALRRVGESHLAQDVAQSVFIELARKPWSVRDPRALAGWLYRAACHTASNTLRTEGRRRQRENIAMSQQATGPNAPSDWQRLEPLVDEAIHTLGAMDQNVIALRFLEGKSLRETGESLSMSEDAVQKRASRALEKLRDFFSRRGFTLTAAGLATALAANTQATIPVGLATAITRKSIAAAAASGAGLTVTLMKIAALLNTKLGLGLAGVIAVAAVTTAVVLKQPARVEQPTVPEQKVASAQIVQSSDQPTPFFARPRGQIAVPPPAQSGTGLAKLSGYVVDAQTGQPITNFALEWGGDLDPNKPGEIGWGFSTEIASPRPGGKFQTDIGFTTGSKLWGRVHADGYLPQPVTPEPFVVPAEFTNLIVRLNHGGNLQGVVLDHSGRPVAGAHVFLAGNQPLNLTDGKDDMFRGSTTTTDAQGRFSLTGAGVGGQKLAVVSDVVQLWFAQIAPPGQETKILLPEPASMLVRYDIPGDADRAELRLELITWEMPDWKGITAVLKPFVTNQGEILLTNLAPGTYDFAREKQQSVGMNGRGSLCDRLKLSLQSGQFTNIDCVRATGFPLTGHITGITNSGVPGAFIYVRPASAAGSLETSDPWSPYYDAVSCGEDGNFQTARLLPGTYTVVAEAYRPETPEEMSRSGIRLPSHGGTAQVTISADTPPSPVTIELLPAPAQ